ncbi:MAG: hypothetical protein JWN92_2390 [Candidatus Acidoferrum typicum]|nr:hypothetical protein [Candidatus Acidoferrum typicum]
MRHLCLKHALQTVASEILRTKTIEMQTVLLRVERGKKRNSLNVIPVIVGHKNVRLDPVRFRLRFQVPSKHAEPGSTIQNYSRSLRRGKFQARGISAVTPGSPVHGRSRAANAPEPECGYRFRCTRARWFGHRFGRDGFGGRHGSQNMVTIFHTMDRIK